MDELSSPEESEGVQAYRERVKEYKKLCSKAVLVVTAKDEENACIYFDEGEMEAAIGAQPLENPSEPETTEELYDSTSHRGGRFPFIYCEKANTTGSGDPYSPEYQALLDLEKEAGLTFLHSDEGLFAAMPQAEEILRKRLRVDEELHARDAQFLADRIDKALPADKLEPLARLDADTLKREGKGLVKKMAEGAAKRTNEGLADKGSFGFGSP